MQVAIARSPRACETIIIMHFKPEKASIYGENLDSLTALLTEWKEPTFRVKQILNWLYQKRVTTFAEMTNLPQSLRTRLEDRFILLPSTHVMGKQSGDITDKLLLELEDNSLIETVLIRAQQEGVGEDNARRTICVSSQVGCAYGCKFCASGLAGWKRNLNAAEIISQLIHVSTSEDKRGHQDRVPFDNIVFMGMGEPLANYDAVVQTIRTLNADWGFQFGARRITISTSGLVPEILKLADEPIQFRLALSLHGSTNEVRQQIMPINRKYPLEDLLPAVSYFSERHGRMLTLEFILIENVNDSYEQAHELAKIALDLHAHVNVIPYNTVEGLPWARPNIKRQIEFGRVLREANVTYTIRREKGHDIDAACGQLRLQTEKSRGTL